MRMHQRYRPVREANFLLEGKLWPLYTALDLDEEQALNAVLLAVTCLLDTVMGQARERYDAPGFHEVSEVIASVRMEHLDLTDVELLGLLTDHQRQLIKYLLRWERHGTMDKKADEE